MKTSHCLIILSLLIAIAAAFSVSPVSANTSHCGNITANENWTNLGNAHVVTCDINIANGVTLTIDEGSIVKFEIGTGIIVNGTLRVEGTSSDPVYFTSLRDDTIGGDTNGDGGASIPDWFDWRGIGFSDSSNDAASLINHAEIRYAGHDQRGSINLNNASPTIKNSTLTDGYMAIRANLGSFPSLIKNTYSDNFYNALSYDGGTISSNSTWAVTDATYYVIDDILVGPGATLKIQPGVVVKFKIGGSLIVNGTLRVGDLPDPNFPYSVFLPTVISGGSQTTNNDSSSYEYDAAKINASSVAGIASAPVYFTSIHDDTVGGDTNGNGGDSTPQWFHWRGIEFRDSSDDAASLIDHAEVRYAGHSDRGGINLNSASPTIRNSTLTDGYLAIRANPNSSPSLINNTYSDNLYNALGYEGGTISSNPTWAVADITYFVIDDIIVGPGSTLKIQSGVVVKFENGRDLIVDGTLQVLGAAANPVYFTSILDDTVGGDTNGDGGASTPDWDNWRGIEFRDSSDDAASLIDHAEVRYAGHSDRGGINLNSASPTIRNSTLTDGYLAIRANPNSSPSLINNTYSDNLYNALGYEGGTISSNPTWAVADITYFVIDDIIVGPGSTLKIQSGVVVKFENGRDLIVDGTLQVLGAAANPVYFTSILDDTVGGDTNGDGGASTPDWDNWRGIEFRDSSDDAASLIDHAEVRYAGHSDRGGINLNSASPAIRNSTLTDGYYGLYTHSSLPSLVCNNIYGNRSYGLYNATVGTVVQAQNQWWGSATGPYDPSTNPGGMGNGVTAGVDYNPWRTSSCP